MGGRRSNGWGNCVWCGEMLAPEDDDPYSDQCPFCLAWMKLKRITVERLQHIRKMIKEVTTEEWKTEHGDTAEKAWRESYETYESIRKSLVEILKTKKRSSYDRYWQTKVRSLPINEVIFVWENIEGLEMKATHAVGDKLETEWQKGEKAFTLKEIKEGE